MNIKTHAKISFFLSPRQGPAPPAPRTRVSTRGCACSFGRASSATAPWPRTAGPSAATVSTQPATHPLRDHRHTHTASSLLCHDVHGDDDDDDAHHNITTNLRRALSLHLRKCIWCYDTNANVSNPIFYVNICDYFYYTNTSNLTTTKEIRQLQLYNYYTHAGNTNTTVILLLIIMQLLQSMHWQAEYKQCTRWTQQKLNINIQMILSGEKKKESSIVLHYLCVWQQTNKCKRKAGTAETLCFCEYV